MMKAMGQEVQDKFSYQGYDSRNWYLIRTKSGNEQRAAFNLSNQGIEVFLPLYKAHQFNFGKINEMKKPLFPGYLFARFDLSSQYHQVKWTRGVSKIVAFGDFPVPVSERIIQAIKGRVGKDNLIKLDEDWREGDIVEIISGPFRSLQGIFQRKISDKGRVKILLSLLGADVSVHISKWQLKRAAIRVGI